MALLFRCLLAYRLKRRMSPTKYMVVTPMYEPVSQKNRFTAEKDATKTVNRPDSEDLL